MWEQLFSTTALAVVLGIFVATAAMGTPTAPRAKAKLFWIVDGTVYSSRFEALRAAIRSGQSSVKKCGEVTLESMVKK